MKIVKINIYFILLFLSIITACSKKEKSIKGYENLLILDVLGDSKMDTLIVNTNKSIKEILLIKKGKTQEIIKLYPLVNEKFVITKPPIENIYLEANYIQTDKKSLRIKVRNTDLQPDYYFIDLSLNEKENYITSFGLINSVDSVYIKIKKVNYKLKSVLDKNKGLNILQFFKNNF